MNKKKRERERERESTKMYCDMNMGPDRANLSTRRATRAYAVGMAEDLSFDGELVSRSREGSSSRFEADSACLLLTTSAVLWCVRTSSSESEPLSSEFESMLLELLELLALLALLLLLLPVLFFGERGDFEEEAVVLPVDAIATLRSGARRSVSVRSSIPELAALTSGRRWSAAMNTGLCSESMCSELMCSLSDERRVKACSQPGTPHWNGFCTMWLCSWRFTLLTSANAALHPCQRQMYGFSPECTRKWRVRRGCSANALSQCGHLKAATLGFVVDSSKELAESGAISGWWVNCWFGTARRSCWRAGASAAEVRTLPWASTEVGCTDGVVCHTLTDGCGVED